MKLRLNRLLPAFIIFAFAALIPWTAFSAEPFSIQEKEQGEFPLALFSQSHDRAVSFIENIQSTRDHLGPSVELNLSYTISFGADDYVDKVLYEDGISVDLTYFKDDDGKIVSISFTEIAGAASPLSGAEDQPSIQKDKRKALDAFDEPLVEIVLNDKKARSSFDELLSSLKRKDSSSTTDSGRPKTIDFILFRKAIDDFKEGQQRARDRYVAQTQPYYDTLTTIFKEGLNDPDSKHDPSQTAQNNPDLSGKRVEIDETVSYIAKEGGPLYNEVYSRITQLQPILFETYIEPNLEKLKNALKNNTNIFRKRLHELLLLEGASVLINSDGTVTEIIIILPQVD